MRLTFVTLALVSLLGSAGPYHPFRNLLEALWPAHAVSVRGVEKEGATVDPNGRTNTSQAGATVDSDGLTTPADSGGWNPNG
jgi:hypothetical protein